MSLKKIRVWNRRKGAMEDEVVYGEGPMRFLYENPLGRGLEGILSFSWISKLVGVHQSSIFSRSKIPNFIQKFQIPMEEFEEGPFSSFNDFFIRKFKPGKRAFTSQLGELPAFAEGRYLGFEKVDPNQVFPVKGTDLEVAELLRNQKWEKTFAGGPLLIARLCPLDYHRYHYPDEGNTLEAYTVSGKLHSVNPVALQHRSQIFLENERKVSILETKNFGKLGYIEVGALCVGKMVQTHEGKSFSRGDEKGYFLFGGSTVILIGEPGRWKPSSDLLKNTQNKIETLVELGEPVGILLSENHSHSGSSA